MIKHLTSPYTPHSDQQLMTELWDPTLALNLRAFNRFVYPWGKTNTPLERYKEARKWQIEEFEKISQHIRDNLERIAIGLTPLIYQSAICSGRGPGKSSFLAFMTHWMMTYVLGSSTTITANTETQLQTKTWPEQGKWLTLAINHHWFDKNALSIRPAPWFEKLLVQQLKIDTGYYYAQAQTWSEENPDSFAGQHNTYGTLIGFDEASGIPKPIWTVAKGFFTEPELHRYWFAFSNGRRNTGPFFECFHKNRKFWHLRNIDSRTVEGVDLAVLNEIIEEHGEDSDEAAIEVKGGFPKQGQSQFISRDVVEDAQIRELQDDPFAALYMGVDPARFGDDTFVIRFRQGRNARNFPVVTRKSIDTTQAIGLCAEWIDKVKPDAVAIDAGSNGAGIIDGLKSLGFKVHEVWFGAASKKPEWLNKRTEMWSEMRDWLPGGCIDDSQDLRTDLTAPEYKFAGKGDKIRLETKEEMKERGYASPNHADALALTFAVKAPRRDSSLLRHRTGRPNRNVARGLDYKIFS